MKAKKTSMKNIKIKQIIKKHMRVILLSILIMVCLGCESDNYKEKGTRHSAGPDTAKLAPSETKESTQLDSSSRDKKATSNSASDSNSIKVLSRPVRTRRDTFDVRGEKLIARHTRFPTDRTLKIPVYSDGDTLYHHYKDNASEVYVTVNGKEVFHDTLSYSYLKGELSELGSQMLFMTSLVEVDTSAARVKSIFCVPETDNCEMAYKKIYVSPN